MIDSAERQGLDHAAALARLGLASLLIERGANVHDRTRAGWDALMISARYGLKEIVEQLLFRGADPRAADRDGRIHRGEVLLLEAFGGGFTWGSVRRQY